MSRKISNIGVLDIRKASEETIKEISKIENVGMVIYSPQTAPLLVKLNIGNMGSSVEVPEEFKLMTGKMEFTRDYFETVVEPVSLVLTGQLFIRRDVTPEDIERNIKGLILIGQVLIPRNLTSIMQQKIINHVGQLVSYPENGILHQGTLNIDDAYLGSLDSNSTLVVFGRLTMLESIDPDLFNEKIESIELTGRAHICEDYKELFYKKTGDQVSFKLSTIPSGYRYFAAPLHLDSLSIKRFEAARIYAQRYVLFGEDIAGDTLDRYISELRCETYIICKASIREAVFKLCPDPETRLLPYSGKLLLIEGDHSLSQSELEYSTELLCPIIMGNLEIEDDVTPEMLMEKIEYLDNFGDVVGNSKQIGVLKTKLRIRKGDMVDRNKTEEEEDSGMSNVGYLKL